MGDVGLSQEQIVAQIRQRQDEIQALLNDLDKAAQVQVLPSQEAYDAVRRMNPIDDLFFARIAENPDAVEEIISTILGVTIKVMSVHPEPLWPQYPNGLLQSRGTVSEAKDQLKNTEEAQKNMAEELQKMIDKSAQNERETTAIDILNP